MVNLLGRWINMRAIMLIICSFIKAQSSQKITLCELCECTDDGPGLDVNCSKRNLNAIPDELPEKLLTLDLSANNISALNSDAFLGTRLSSLDLRRNPCTCANQRATRTLRKRNIRILHDCKAGSCVNGNWGRWSDYGACAKTCGLAHQSRSRQCDSPPASADGVQCLLSDGSGLRGKSEKEYIECELNPCLGEPQGEVSFTFHSQGDDYNQKELQGNISKVLKEKLNMFGSSPLYADIKNFTVPADGKFRVVAQLSMANGNVEQSLEFCEKMGTLTYVYIPLINTTVKLNFFSYDCCYKEEIGELNYRGVYAYKTTLKRHTVQKRCKYNSKTIFNRKCLIDSATGGAKWAEADLEGCHPKTATTRNLIILSQMQVCDVNHTKSCTGVVQTAEKLTNIVQNGSVLTNSRDIKFVSDIMTQLIESADVNQTVQISNDIIGTVSKVFDTEESIIRKAEMNNHASSNMLHHLNNLAVKIGDSLSSNDRDVAVSTKNIGFQISKAPSTVYAIQAETSSNDVRITKAIDVSVPTFKGAAVLRSAAFHKPKNAVFSYAFRDPKLFVRTDTKSRETVGSIVLRVSLGNTKRMALAEPVILRFKKKQRGNVSCKFWESKKGEWSSDGCRVVNITSDDIVTCACDHLTNFALLFNIYNSTYNPFELQVVSTIGCVISILGLILTFFVHASIRKLRSSLHSKILICLSLSLLVMFFTFVTSVTKTKPRIGCQIISGIVYYFMLASFLWMAVTSVNLLQKVVFAMATRNRNDTYFFIGSCLVAWGFPLILVIIIAAVEPASLGDDEICFLKGTVFTYAVLLPIILILAINIITLIAIMVKLTRRSPIVHVPAAIEHPWRNVRIAFMCSVQFGLTWVFGILAVGDASAVFQWLFCLFNSTQGIFIFVFYTLREPYIHGEIRKYLEYSDVQFGLHTGRYVISSKSETDRTTIRNSTSARNSIQSNITEIGERRGLAINDKIELVRQKTYKPIPQ